MDDALRALSEREKEALRLLAGGHDAKSVARHLGLSIHTVNERLRSARGKMGLTSSRAVARRLAEAEARTETEQPKFLGDKQFGDDAMVRGVGTVTSLQSRRGLFAPRWIIGGLTAMLSLAVAAFVFSQAAAPVAPAASSSAPAASPTPAVMIASEAGEAALAWIALLDREQWAESWNAAGNLFRTQVAQTDWASTVASVRGSVGPVVSRTQISAVPSTSLPGLPAGEYEVVQYRTAFRDKPDSVETAALMREGQTWHVIGYFIR